MAIELPHISQPDDEENMQRVGYTMNIRNGEREFIVTDSKEQIAKMHLDATSYAQAILGLTDEEFNAYILGLLE